MKADEYVAVAMLVILVMGAGFLAARWYVGKTIDDTCAAIPRANLNVVESLAAENVCSALAKLKGALAA